MRIYLHVGLHKTGTSAVQQAFRQNEALLANEGVLYPASGRPDLAGISSGHHLLPWTLIAPSRVTGDPWAQLRDELSRRSEQVAVLSSEEFDVLHREDQFARLRAELRGYDIKLIVYLRRQDELLHAMYYTDVLYFRELRSFEAYMDAFRTHLDYRELLAPWEAWLGRDSLIVRAYERKALIGGHIIPDFLDCVGLGGLSLRVHADRLVNRSLPRNVIGLIRALREVGVDEQEIREVAERASAFYPDKTQSDILSPSARRAVMARYHDSNAYVARSYLGRDDGQLFEDVDLGDQSEWEERYEGPFADLIATLADAHQRVLDLEIRAG